MEGTGSFQLMRLEHVHTQKCQLFLVCDESGEDWGHTDPFAGIRMTRKITFFSISAELHKEQGHEQHTNIMLRERQLDLG